MMSDKDYKVMECSRCHKLNVCLVDEADDTKRHGKELRCIHCGCSDMPELDKYAGLCECMGARKYKRNRHGAIEQE